MEPQLCLRSPLQMTLRATNALSTYDCFSFSETGPQKSPSNSVSLTLLDMLLEAGGLQPALCGPSSLGRPEHAGRRSQLEPRDTGVSSGFSATRASSATCLSYPWPVCLLHSLKNLFSGFSLYIRY